MSEMVIRAQQRVLGRAWPKLRGAISPKIAAMLTHIEQPRILP